MSADKVQEAYAKALAYGAYDVLDREMRDVLDALIAAVREDERERCYYRVEALRGPDLGGYNNIIEDAMGAIRNA